MLGSMSGGPPASRTICDISPSMRESMLRAAQAEYPPGCAAALSRMSTYRRKAFTSVERARRRSAVELIRSMLSSSSVSEATDVWDGAGEAGGDTGAGAVPTVCPCCEEE